MPRFMCLTTDRVFLILAHELSIRRLPLSEAIVLLDSTHDCCALSFTAIYREHALSFHSIDSSTNLNECLDSIFQDA